MSSKVQTYHDHRVAPKQRSSEPTVRGAAAIREDIHLAPIIEWEKYKPRLLNPLYVLRLQRTIGNQAVHRHLIAHEGTHVVQQPGSNRIRVASRNEKRALPPISLTLPAHIQREEIEMEGFDMRPKGLLVEKHVKDVTGKWADVWRSKKGSTIRILIEEMFKIVNAKFSGLRVAPVIFDPTPSTTEAMFHRQGWNIGINLDIILSRTVSFDDKVSSLSADDLARIGDSLYHEARHAEQAFLVARKRAITIRDPDTLAQNLEIPVPVAKAAIDAGPPGRDNPDVERIEEWSAFEPSGKYYEYWKWNEAMKKVTKDYLEPIVTRSPKTLDEYRSAAADINTTINLVGTKWVFPFDKLVEIEKLSAPTPIDKDVLEQLRKITSAFEKLVRAIDDFRSAADKLKGVKSDSDEGKLLILEADAKWLGIRVAQLDLFIAQGKAYEAYPMELDARRAGIAAKGSILAATRPARAR